MIWAAKGSLGKEMVLRACLLSAILKQGGERLLLTDGQDCFEELAYAATVLRISSSCSAWLEMAGALPPSTSLVTRSRTPCAYRRNSMPN